VRDGELGLGALLVLLMVGVELFRPMRELRELLHQGMLGQAAAQGIRAVLDAVPAVAERPGAAAPAALPPTLAFEDVHFAYPGGRRAAHRGLDFALAAGERVAVVGASGAGKTSILRLLLRLYDPERGVVRVRRRRRARADDRGAARHFAVVSQDT
jgi:ATP-binding cassette subfamily C protein CydCD